MTNKTSSTVQEECDGTCIVLTQTFLKKLKKDGWTEFDDLQMNILLPTNRIERLNKLGLSKAKLSHSCTKLIKNFDLLRYVNSFDGTLYIMLHLSLPCLT